MIFFDEIQEISIDICDINFKMSKKFNIGGNIFCTQVPTKILI